MYFIQNSEVQENMAATVSIHVHLYVIDFKFYVHVCM